MTQASLVEGFGFSRTLGLPEGTDSTFGRLAMTDQAQKKAPAYKGRGKIVFKGITGSAKTNIQALRRP